MKLSDHPIVFLTKKFWEFSKGNRKHVVLFTSMLVLSNVVSFFQPLLLAHTINIIQLNGITDSNIWSILFFLSMFIVLELGFWMFHGPARILENRNAFKVRANFQEFILRGTMNLSATWHTDHHSGDTIDKISHSSQSLFEHSWSNFLIIETVLRLIGSYAALVYFNIHSAYIVAIIVIATFTIVVKFDKILVKRYKELYEKENKIAAKIFDSISNITTIIILRIEKLVLKSIMKKINEPYDLFMKNTKLNEAKWFLVSFFGGLMAFLVLASYVYSNYVSGTTILIGTLSALYSYVTRIHGLFYRFAYEYGRIVQRKTQVQNSDPITKLFKDEKKQIRTKHFDWNHIAINNLTFTYHTEGKKDVHLVNINFEIKKNSKIALIGSSGSGKTTFMKIFRELYEAKEMVVKIDHIEEKDGISLISPHVTLIPQDPEIFNSTIKKNITMGIQHPLKEIKKFTDMAMFTKVVERLPNKWDSTIVEKGVNLSGGEKQRLALARGLLAARDKEFVLLDEPTSSVDSKNEYKIYKNIFKEFKDKTVISSIHKLHLLPMFDYIYYFRGGKIIAHGDFKTISKESKSFQQIWKKYTKSHKE